MQISRNIVNGPKNNKYVLVGILVIVCIPKESHHFLQTFFHYACVRLCSAIVDFIRNSCLYIVCYGWSAQVLTTLATLPVSVAW